VLLRAGGSQPRGPAPDLCVQACTCTRRFIWDRENDVVLAHADHLPQRHGVSHVGRRHHDLAVAAADAGSRVRDDVATSPDGRGVSAGGQAAWRRASARRKIICGSPCQPAVKSNVQGLTISEFFGAAAFLQQGRQQQWRQLTHWTVSVRDPQAVDRRNTRLFAKKFDLAQRPRGGSVTNKKCRYTPPPVVPCHTRLCAYAVQICRARRDILALLEHGVHLMRCCIPGCHVRQHAPQS
jgi:hypothetical protein